MIENLLKICLTSTDRNEFKSETKNLDKASISRLVNTVYTDEIGHKPEFYNSSCLLLASYVNNFDLVRHLVEDCDASTELLVGFNENELWDKLTFSKLELDSYSFLSNDYQNVNNFKAPVLWHLCRLSSHYDNLAKIIKYLVKKGANVSSCQETTFSSTPLM